MYDCPMSAFKEQFDKVKDEEKEGKGNGGGEELEVDDE
jgi:hypothetical protein